MTARPIGLPVSEIAKVRDRLAREGWTDDQGSWAPCRPTDLNITSITESVRLVERDPSPCIPRIACDGVSAKESRMKPETLHGTRTRAWRARRFPTNTCPASRHLHLLADTLASGKIPVQFAEDPTHCAQSIYATLTALWEMRAAKAEAPRTTVRDGISQQKEIG